MGRQAAHIRRGRRQPRPHGRRRAEPRAHGRRRTVADQQLQRLRRLHRLHPGRADHTYSDPLAKDVNQPGAAEGAQHRHQTYEPVPIGYAIQDEDGADFNSSPVWAVDQIAWEQLGGRTVGITTADQATLGELRLGSGNVRIIGALVPMPTEQYYHPYGLANYALTYSGYQVLQNALTP